jgi:hypothetical protein
LGGAASPPGEARGAVPEWSTSSLRSPPPSARHPPGRSPQHDAYGVARGTNNEAGFLPPGAKRRWGEWRSRRRRRGGPSPELWYEFAPLTTPLGPASAGPVPPNGLRPRGDKQVPQGVSPPRSEATLGGAASPPGEARGAVPGVVDEFAPLTTPLGPASAGPVPPVPQGVSPPRERSDIGGSSLAARRGKGGRPRADPRVRSAHRPPRPGNRRAGPPSTPSPPARSRGGQTSGRPRDAKMRRSREGSSAGGCRGAVPEVVHEFASLTAPPQTASGRGGTDTWKTPRVSPPRSGATLGGAASPPGEARGAVREGKISS